MYRKAGVFCSESVQYLWQMICCYWLEHWRTEKWGCSVQKMYNICHDWLTLYWLGPWKWGCSVQSNLCFMPSWKCTIFVTMSSCHWLGRWCTEKWGCSIQKVYNMCDEWLTVIGLDTDVQKSGAACISGSGIWLADYNGLTDNTNLVPFIPFGDLDQYSPLFQGFIVFWTYIIIFQVRELGLLWWAEYVQYICCTHLYGSC